MDHEHFDELSALAAIGQISPEEYLQLKAHWEECPTCRSEYAAFTDILSSKLPMLHPERESSSPAFVAAHVHASKMRFLERIGATDVPAARVPSAARKVWEKLQPLLTASSAYAGVALVLLVALASALSLRVYESSVLNHRRLDEIKRLNNQIDALQKQLSELSDPAKNALATPANSSPGSSADAGGSHSGSARMQLAGGVVVSRAEYARLAVRNKLLQQELRDARDRLGALAAQTESGKAKESDLAGQLEQAQQNVARISAELDASHSRFVADAETLGGQQARLNELQAQLAAEVEGRERDRRLLAADRDIRDLMGARNLHIIDVFDVDGRGKTRRPFGRVFFTEGKSLIFYAFDLGDRSASPRNASFQAWGYKDVPQPAPHSLGIFYQDDQKANRWVLKFDDPDVLAEIDSVFVTIEPAGGSNKPTGQKLLSAYVRAGPNHP
jgi:peptidoglycan hydrolase CwlO-like protein